MTVTLVSLLVLAAGCGAPAEPEGQALAPMDLVRVGTIGGHPDDIPGPVAILDIHRDGRMVLDGAEIVSYDALRTALKPLADADRDESNLMHPSDLHYVLRCDRDVPWRSVQWAVQAGADPELRVHRVLFGVLPPTGDREGTLALFLPMDRGTAGAKDAAGGTKVAARLRTGEVGSSPAALAERLETGEPPAYLEIDAGGDVSVGFVLRVADAAIRAGAPAITLTGAGPPESGAGATAASATSPRVSIRVDGGEILGDVGAEPPPPVRVNGLAGSIGPFSILIEDPVIKEVKREGPK